MNGASSDFFSCNVGVRQGENCPYIYSLCLLMTWNRNTIGLQSITAPFDEDLLLYLKL